MSNEKRRQLSAILFADIQGYSALMQANEAKAMKFLNHYQSILQESVSSHKGEVVKNYGDGSLCLFNSILSAVLCAQDLQLQLRKEPVVPLRIGLHVGDIMHAGNDVYGDALNIAARIESMGVPGCVLLSDSIYNKIKNQAHLKMESLGEFEFKNIEQAIEVFALANDGLVVPERSQLSGKFKEKKKKTFASSKILWLLPILLLLGTAWYFAGPSRTKDEVTDQNLSKLKETPTKENSIAVLAFADMSNEQDQKYFSEGISEEILNLLTKIPDLKVISRSSSFAFKDKNVTSSEIGSALNVNHLLDGSIRKSGNTLRISTQLIEAISGQQLWSEVYDRPMDDIFKIQDEIAARVTPLSLVKRRTSPIISEKSLSRAHSRGRCLKGKTFPSRVSLAATRCKI